MIQNVNSLSKALTLVTVVAVALVALAFVTVAKCETYTYSFTYDVNVSTASALTLSDVTSFTLYLPPGVNGTFKVTIGVKNTDTANSQTATIKISCLSNPSTSITLAAGATGTVTLTLTIPTPPTSYIECPVSSDNTAVVMTSVNIDEMHYTSNIEMVYNTTNVNYTITLFTIPYVKSGTSVLFFSSYKLELAKNGTSLVNATFTTEASDSYVSASSITAGNELDVVISDSMPYTGRYLGTLKIMAKVNEYTLNIFVKPKNSEPSSANIPNLIIKPNVDYVIIPIGEELKLGLINPNTVIDSSGTEYTFNYTIVRFDIINLGNDFVKKIESSVLYRGYNVTYFASGVPRNETIVEVLMLGNITGWYEPMYMKVKFITRYINITVKWTMPTMDVTPFVNITHALFNGINVTTYNSNLTGLVIVSKLPVNVRQPYVTTLPTDSGYIIIRAMHEGEPIYDYVIRFSYVCLVKKDGTVLRYTNVSTITPISDITLDSITYASDNSPIATFTINNYYERVASDVHAVIYMPGYGTSSIELSVSKLLPIRFTLLPTIRVSGLSNIYVFTIVDDKAYSKIARTVSTNYAEVSISKVSLHCYMMVIPATLNYTSITVELSADLKVTVTWNDSSPAKNVIVELYSGTTLISRKVTDAKGVAIFDPYYGSYRVVAIFNDKLESKDVTLTDDYAVTLKFDIPPPKVKVSKVDLYVSDTKVPVNSSVRFNIIVTLEKPTDSPITYSGHLVCTGATEFEEIVEVGFAPGEQVSSTSIETRFTKEGKYTCYAVIGGVMSNTVVVEVVGGAEAAAMQLPIKLTTEQLLLFIVIIVLIVLIAILIKITRRIRVY